MPISNDRSLMAFHENALQFIADILDCGFDDLPELALKVQGLRNEIDQLEVRACAIAGEQAERMTEPHDSGWVAQYNAGVNR